MRAKQEPSMTHLDHEARTRGFWGSLTPDQLHYIRTMLVAIVTSGEAKAQASYHLGVTEATIRDKYNLCPKCAQSHDTDEYLRNEVSLVKSCSRCAHTGAKKSR